MRTFWNRGDGSAENLLSHGTVSVEILDHGFYFYGGFVRFPAIIVCHESQCCRCDFRFAAESGFRAVRHADDVCADHAVKISLSAGLECWAVHAKIRTAVVDLRREQARGGE